MPTSMEPLIVEPIPMGEAKAFCLKWHYSPIFPPHCLLALGYRDTEGLAGVSIWGWGTRPKHTIKKLFPSLDTNTYRELCRLCLRDELPRNSESRFLAQCANWIRKHQPQIDLLFSWSDGIRGKPGYVYQASGWLYGGCIQTEIYLTKEGEPVHPRLLISRYGRRDRIFCRSLGLRKVRGYQFRYLRFLCGHARRKALLRESSVSWGNQDYPKNDDLRWTVDAEEGSRETREPPRFERSVQFRHSAPLLPLC